MSSLKSIAQFILYACLVHCVVCHVGKSPDQDIGRSVSPDETLSIPEPRIIGGSNARQDRYPYFASLVVSSGQHTCGGTLVAPDMILTAAHCQGSIRRAQIGRWSRLGSGDSYQEISIDSENVHPDYNEDGFKNDFMLLKLTSQSTLPFVRLNQDWSLPRGNIADELKAIGFGNTISDRTSLSSFLQEIDVAYIPNALCELSRDAELGLTYQNQIIDSMLCAGDEGQDSCQGDSGGPLLITGGSAAQDVQVGVISWGFGCALPKFPGVYSRISAEMTWIKAVICETSLAPPEYLNCDDASTLPPKSVPVTVSVQLDDFPEETRWAVTDEVGATIYAEAPFGTYSEARARVSQSVFLPAGQRFIFFIDDSFGDGLCCNRPGNYFVTLGSNSNGEILVSGGGGFEGAQVHNFDVPIDFEEDGNNVDSIGNGQIELTIAIQLDNRPFEIGWKVERLDIEVESVIDLPAGIYKTPQAKIVRTLVLERGELYHFRMYDIATDGIENGYVQLFLGTVDIEDESRKIYEVNGDFKGGTDFSFLAEAEGEIGEMAMNTEGPFLTLILYFDLYPGEVSVQIRASKSEVALERQARENEVVLFRPPRYYSDAANRQVIERIPIRSPSTGARREFTLVVTDSFNDGLCCNWNSTEQTGYTLFLGDPDDDEIIIDSRFIGVGREVNSFFIDGPSGMNRDPGLADIELVDIRVTITLDDFPDETGFQITDSSGLSVADYPPGTYRNTGQIVEERISLPVGLYTFTILDTFGDGINRQVGAFFRIEIVDDDERLPILAGSDAFVSELSQTFVLEGKIASYPMTINFSTDEKPEEFGFTVKRLDLIEGDALVASAPRGSYQESKATISEKIMVTHGALYRVFLMDAGKDGVGSESIEVIMGGDGYPLDSSTIDATQLSSRQLKLYAGEPPIAQPNGISIDFRIFFDEFPHDIEWILVAGRDPFASGAPISTRRRVISYGPLVPFSDGLAGKEYTETIYLPEHQGERIFTLIVTDSAGDGICCRFGSGGPIEVYLGSAQTGEPIFSSIFQDSSRFVQSFVLQGSSASSSRFFGGLLVVVCATLVLLHLV